MTPYDPYQAPGTAYAPMVQPTGNEPITPAMIESLRSAKPWIRLMSILSFIASGVMVLASVLVFSAAAFVPVRKTPGAELTPFLGLIYLPFTIFYLIPAISMHRYAGTIDQLLTGFSARAMEEVLERNHSFWKVVGIMALVMVGLTVLVILGTMVAAVAAGLSR
jgi:hypothetical protein